MAGSVQVHHQAAQPSPIQVGEVWVRLDGSASLCVQASATDGGALFVPLGSTSAAVPVDPVQATGTLTTDNTNSANGDTVTIGTVGQGNGPRTYTIRTALTRATTILTVAGTAPADGDTVTINAVVYRFKDTLAQNNDVKRSATATVNLTNLAEAIMDNGSTGFATRYTVASGDGAGTGANATVTSSTLSGSTITLTAIPAGSIGRYAVSAASAGTVRLTFTAATFTGGVDDEVLIAGTADGTLLNLARLINGTGAGTEGTDYSRRGTTAEGDPHVSASTSVTSHAITITADAVAGGLGAEGNTLGTVTASAGTNHLSFGAATLTGGVSGTVGSRGMVSTDGTSLFVCVAPNTWKKITLSALS